MAYKLDRRREYRFSADHLGPLARLQLRFAESVIADRADRLSNTTQVMLAGREVTLYGYADLAIYLEITLPGRVELYLVVDGRNLPDWYTHPTGTWFEEMDLVE